MALSTEQSLQLYGTPAYTGWGETEAAADAKAKGLTAPGSGISGLAGSLISGFESDVDKYVNDLIGFANEDYNFAAKWIEDNYKKVAGTDPDKAAFLKKVANALESKVGRIEYDYNTGEYRNREDKQIALDRLASDEKQLRAEEAAYQDQTRQDEAGNLNARGLLSTTREKAVGLAGKEVGKTEGTLTRRMDALNRLVREKRQDINLGSSRGLEDLTTTARRAFEDATSNKDYQIALAEQEKKRREREAQLQGESLKKNFYGNYKSYV